MLAPKDVPAAAAKLEDENLRFRTFLKIHADPDELDQQFLALHRELFAGYDCCQCGNCCRRYSTILSEEEIDVISAYLGMTRQKFLEDCLIRGRDGLELPAPCRFLDMDGRCWIQECKPEECNVGDRQDANAVMHHFTACPANRFFVYSTPNLDVVATAHTEADTALQLSEGVRMPPNP